MGTLPSGLGLISGFDTSSVIQQMLAFQTQSRNSLQAQLGLLQARRTATLDLNASLLALIGDAATLRSASMFGAMSATSANADVLTATASDNATAGTYQFLIAGLASHHQMLSAGVGSDLDALGLHGATLEQGGGDLAGDVPLAWLNGGDGVTRGEIRLTDQTTGAQTVVDLSDAVLLSDVVAELNLNGLDVGAHLVQGRIVLQSESGAAFTVTEVGAGSTGADLGLIGSSSDGRLEGHRLLTLGADLTVAALRDGNGLLVREGLADLRITTRSGRIFDVDLSRAASTPLTDATPLADLNAGGGVMINASTGDPDLALDVFDQVTGETTSWEVDLTGCLTIGDLRMRIAEATANAVTIAISGDGRGFDAVPANPTDTLVIRGAGSNGSQTAEDLGLFEPDGVLGGVNGRPVSLPATPTGVTLETVLAAINASIDLTGAANDGAIVARIADDGQRLELIDQTTGSGELTVAETAANGSAVRMLGWAAGSTVDGVLTGNRILGDVGTVLISELRGGGGLREADHLTITDRHGVSVTMNGLSLHETLDDLISAVNEAASAAGVDAVLAVDAAGTGVTLEAGQGPGMLAVSGDLAVNLGMTVSDEGGEARSGNLQHRWISAATQLSDLNLGRGIGIGSFRIRDARGVTSTITLSSQVRTVQDILDLINSRGLAVDAQLNETGDGLHLVSTVDASEAIVPLRVESLTGTTAADLRLEGEGDQTIEGRWETVLEINATTSLRDLMEQINAADLGVTASLLNTGESGNPWRLSLSSDVSGAAARMIVSLEGGPLDFEEIVAARDARVVIGDDPVTGVLLTSGSNDIEGIVDGLSLSLIGTSPEVVSVTVAGDDDVAREAVRSFVEGLNAVLEKIERAGGYDPETGQRGILYGDTTANRIRRLLISAIQGGGVSEDVAIDGPWQIGLRMGAGGRVEFDEEVFAEMWTERRDDVETFLTISANDSTDGRSGFGERIGNLIDQLTRSGDGTLAAADGAWQGRITLATNRLSQLDARLESRRLQLVAQFAAMEEALSSLQNQYLSILSIGTGAGSLSSFLG